MSESDLVSLRRELHRRPEPAWCEYYTTGRLVEALQELDLDELYVGRDALAGEHRLAMPDSAEGRDWFEKARDAGTDPEILEQLEGGYTGAVAVIHQGAGPTVGLRVDIDGLPRTESTGSNHIPAAEGFRSEHDGVMHACGHDGHMTIGVGVLEAIRESDFSGTLKVFFQPAEEVIGGGKAMAKSEHIEDVDYLLAMHLGLDHPTGEVVAGVEGFLAVAHLEATFTGEGAHAGGRPEEGRNAVQALATATQNAYGISRHSEGKTRINVGVIEGGTAANIIPEHAEVVAEVRGETTELMEYMRARAETVFENAAAIHDCAVEIDLGAEAPSAVSDDELRSIVASVASDHEITDTVLERDELGGSEDATFLMQTVQDRGGLACYVGIGTDHPGGHHTGTFDVDERSIGHGVDVLTGAIERIGQERP